MSEALIGPRLPREFPHLPAWILDKTLQGLDKTYPTPPDPILQTVQGEKKSWGPVEQALQERFPAIVENLDLASSIQLEEGRQIPKGLEKYHLVPLVNDEDEWYPHSTDTAAQVIKIPEGVTPYYGKRGEKPWMDTSYAIGLVYKGILTAIAAGHTTYTGNIRVSQLQGVYKNPIGQGYGYKSGLFGGFLWRNTLVQAWAEVARELGAPAIEVLGAENSLWKKKSTDMRAQLKKGYDDVAKAMGFQRDRKGNWERSLMGAVDT